MLTRDTVATQHRARLASLYVHQSRTQLPVPNMIVSGLQSSSRCFRPALVSPVLPQQLLRTRVGARPLQQLHAAASAARAAAEVVRTTPAAAEAVIPTILDTMGEAFRTDDLQELLGVPLHKRDVLFKELTAALLKGHRQDRVLYYAGQGQCACVVLSKEQSQNLSFFGLLTSGVFWALITTVPLTRMHILLDVWDTLKEEEVALKEAGVDQYIKVVILGTHPSAQGKGLGSAVLKAISADADAAGLPLYLEAASRDAARLYERQGYKIIKTVLEGGKEVLLMLREPGQQG